jgi:D-sedoheptulose 7-phosphate isomerase
MNQIAQRIADSIAVKTAILQDTQMQDQLQEIADLITRQFQAGKRLYFCGNGGSAADAQHLAAEFTGRFYLNRRALPAEALHVNSSYLTAVANDYDYQVIYARLVEGICEPGDVLIGLSTSGNSPNIVQAFDMARTKGVTTIGFTGAGGGQLASRSDYLFAMPSSTTPRIQEAHMLLGHILCEWVEASFFKTV